MTVKFSKPILTLDFDGVIHSYANGFQGIDVISEQPVDGAFEFITRASEFFEINIYSARSGHPEGLAAMKKWMRRQTKKFYGRTPDWLSRIKWPTSKPATFVGLDDRVLTFKGKFPDINDLIQFKSWQKGEF